VKFNEWEYAKDEICDRYGGALIMTRIHKGKEQFRVLNPHGRRQCLSNWCGSEEKAWIAALYRECHRVNSIESW